MLSPTISESVSGEQVWLFFQTKKKSNLFCFYHEKSKYEHNFANIEWTHSHGHYQNIARE